MALCATYLKSSSISIEDLPIEVLEIIFTMLPSVADQINLSTVCQLWRQIVLDLRHRHKRCAHKRVAKRCPAKRCLKTCSHSQAFTFDRHVYTRLPVAGSLNDWGKYFKQSMTVASISC